MKFSRAEISDIIIIEPNAFSDHRGYFFESFKEKELTDFLGYKINFCQDNESKSSYGVLRGLHYQEPPFDQTKLVRVIQGKVLDVAVDIRKESPSYAKHIAIELSEENKKQLLIPKGFAHGFVVLSEIAIFSYKVDNYYNRESDMGIAYNDPNIGIDWKIKKVDFRISDKDLNNPLLLKSKLY